MLLANELTFPSDLFREFWLVDWSFERKRRTLPIQLCRKNLSLKKSTELFPHNNQVENVDRNYHSHVFDLKPQCHLLSEF